MKKHCFWGISILLIFAIFSTFVFANSLTPYVSFAQAKSSDKGRIQIRGSLIANSIARNEDSKSIQFILSDDKEEQVRVVYRGNIPSGFEQASSIAAIGKYENGQFTAQKLLVKCPSKYQEEQGGANQL